MYDWRKMTDRERQEALAARQAERRPWHGPPHQVTDERFYHLHAACYEHAPFLGLSVARMADFESELLNLLKSCCERVHAWCILPNHYHLLVETPGLKLTTGALGRLHGRTSFLWNREEGKRGRQVWHRCPDRAIRSQAHYWATMNYVHNQPVRHGLCTRWDQWPFSSAKDFLEAVGREEARRIWRAFPLLDYGKGWDDPEQ